LAHAYILSGPARLGKKTIALQWLSEIIGIPLSISIAHPDFNFVAPLKDPKTDQKAAEITVAQIRNLINKLSLTPIAAPFKAAIIDDAHLMNIEAQNFI